jgi:hypothetical protein
MPSTLKIVVFIQFSDRSFAVRRIEAYGFEVAPRSRGEATNVVTVVTGGDRKIQAKTSASPLSPPAPPFSLEIHVKGSQRKHAAIERVGTHSGDGDSGDRRANALIE